MSQPIPHFQTYFACFIDADIMLYVLTKSCVKPDDTQLLLVIFNSFGVPIQIGQNLEFEPAHVDTIFSQPK